MKSVGVNISTGLFCFFLFLAFLSGFFLTKLPSSAEASKTPIQLEDTDETKKVIININSHGVDRSPLLSQESKQDFIDQKQDQVVSTHESLIEDELIRLENIPAIVADLNEQEIAAIESDPRVNSIQENQLFEPSLVGSIPLINADDVHTAGFDGTGVAVAILDTGVDSTHSFVNVTSEACYSNAGGAGGGIPLCPGAVTSSTAPGSGANCTGISGCDHGTHVAGAAAGTGAGVGFTGVAPDADIIAIQVFTRYDGAICTFSVGFTPCLLANTSDIILGLDRVLTLEGDIGFTTPIASANLSLGGGIYSNQATCDSDNAATKVAVDNLRAVDIATIIAAGNDGVAAGIASPGCISTAVAVGSTTKVDTVSGFSNSGSLMDLWAPGSSINSSVIGDGNFGIKSGTSMAAPHVTGAWALAKEKVPNASVANVLEAFQDNGVDITDARNGLTFARIDVESALDHPNLNDIIVDVVDERTDETGDTATVQFSLRSAPTDDVNIPVSLSDLTEGDLGGVTDILIDMADWNNPSANTLTITGLDDIDGDGDMPFMLITGDPTSTDPTYDALTASDVFDPYIINNDDEVKHGDIIFGDTNGDGIDEAHFVKYTNTGSGTIELHTWNSNLTGWVANRSSNHPEVTQGHAEVILADTGGDGVDEPYFVKYTFTGTGMVEIHRWNSAMTGWVYNLPTNHPSAPKHDVSVRFADTDGNGVDEAHFVKFLNTGTGQVEIHRWNSNYSGWIAQRPTNHPERPRYETDVIFGHFFSPAFEHAAFVKFNNGGTSTIETHFWDTTYSSFIAQYPSTHGDVIRYDNGYFFGDLDGNGIDEPNFTKIANTGSGTLEVHTWFPDFLNWRFHFPSNHPDL